MSLGLYVHIPYCLQICTYCDFVKFESKDLPQRQDYVDLLVREIDTRHSPWLDTDQVETIYFGGGTPSLFSAKELEPVLRAFERVGLDISTVSEVTLEVNPGTIDPASLADYLRLGFNRFSVGVQTFDPKTLQQTGRKHSIVDSVETLELLKSRNATFSLDLIFAFPGQTLDSVIADVERALSFDPKHISLYCLTVPERHPLNHNRPSEKEQAQLFQAIADRLEAAGRIRYEISNFAVPGSESKHNQLYWQNQPYWGIGIGAHSYLPKGSNRLPESAPWGIRYWNPNTVAAWEKELEIATGADYANHISPNRLEILKPWQTLTDVCHTSLRARSGLSIKDLSEMFGSSVASEVLVRLRRAMAAGWIEQHRTEHYRLTAEGIPLADQVFTELTFLESDSLTFSSDDTY